MRDRRVSPDCVFVGTRRGRLRRRCAGTVFHQSSGRFGYRVRLSVRGAGNGPLSNDGGTASARRAFRARVVVANVTPNAFASRADPAADWPPLPVRHLVSRACSSPTCSWLWDYAGPYRNSRLRSRRYCLPVRSARSAPEMRFTKRGSRPVGLRFIWLLGTPRKTRGQDGSLLFSCRALSSPTIASRFYPDDCACLHAPRKALPQQKNRCLRQQIRHVFHLPRARQKVPFLNRKSRLTAQILEIVDTQKMNIRGIIPVIRK